jgi:2-polyprenyl-3-methyl-5-hydroxy-6-metoxy-1,4-benzoquinol methylase
MAYSEESAARFAAPVFIGNMFATESDEEEDQLRENNARASQAEFGLTNTSALNNNNNSTTEVIRTVDASGMRYEQTIQQFPHINIKIRQFDDHHRNANICWPEARCLAEWLIGEHIPESSQTSHDVNSVTAAISESRSEGRRARFDRMLIGFPSGLSFPSSTIAAAPSPALSASPVCNNCGQHQSGSKRVLELGAATGALAIFLSTLGVNMHTSDIADPAVTNNIAHNYTLNGMDIPIHFPHSWGENLNEIDEYITKYGAPDVILGSDILAYEDDFEKLADTICRLMPSPNSDSASKCPSCTYIPTLYMCWKRSCNQSLLDVGFWKLLHECGFHITTSGQKTYEITRPTGSAAETALKYSGLTTLLPGQYVHYLHGAIGPHQRKEKAMKKAAHNATAASAR